MTITKTSACGHVQQGARVEIELTVSNFSDMPQRVLLRDEMIEGFAYIEGSVAVNGVAAPSLDVCTGIDLGYLQAGEVRVIIYSVTAYSGGGCSAAHIMYGCELSDWQSSAVQTARSEMLCMHVDHPYCGAQVSEF